MQKNNKCTKHKFLPNGVRRWNLYKKADMPHWMMMLLWTIVGLLVVLGIVMLQKVKIFEFLEWLG